MKLTNRQIESIAKVITEKRNSVIDKKIQELNNSYKPSTEDKRLLNQRDQLEKLLTVQEEHPRLFLSSVGRIFPKEQVAEKLKKAYVDKKVAELGLKRATVCSVEDEVVMLSVDTSTLTEIMDRLNG